VTELAAYLQLAPGTIHNWLFQGKITDADGKVSLGTRQLRFRPRVVKQRCKANLFARGLDKDGNPVIRSKLRAVV
jgi:hypothetical protein